MMACRLPRQRKSSRDLILYRARLAAALLITVLIHVFNELGLITLGLVGLIF
jgi:hypothetical protein